jgi:hypothetical protein
MSQRLPHLPHEIHDKIAQKAGIKAARVRCEKCKRERDVDGGKCIAMGWPSCCGYTMTLLTKR